MSTKKTAGKVVRFVSARERLLDSVLQESGITLVDAVVQGDRDIRQWLQDERLRQDALEARRSWDKLARQMGFRSLAAMASHIRRLGK